MLVALITIVVFFVLIIPMMILNGWILSTMWGWFVVPTFHAPSMNVVSAIGIVMTVRLLIGVQENKDDKKQHILIRLFVPIAVSLIVLLMGWIVKQWM